MDAEFLDALADAEEGDPLKISKAVRMLLGDAQRKRLYDHLRSEKGKVPLQAVMEAFQDILTNGGTATKNS